MKFSISFSRECHLASSIWMGDSGNFQLLSKWTRTTTLPETNIAHENPIFPGKYHQNGGFSMAMLVYRRVHFAIFQFPITSII